MSTHNSKTVNLFESLGSKDSNKIIWRNVIIIMILHVIAIYGFYLWMFDCKWQTVLIVWYLFMFNGLGVTAGAHRLWAHRSYKAKLSLRILLMIMNCSAFEGDIYEWSRDHRVHHKYSETDADPHNAKRGFFFAHIGWLMMKKHPEVIRKGKLIDLTDVLSDSVVQFQRRFYFPLVYLWCFIIPTAIPYYLWNENVWTSFFVCGIFRYVFFLVSLKVN